METSDADTRGGLQAQSKGWSRCRPTDKHHADLSFNDQLQPESGWIDLRTTMGTPVTPWNTLRKSWGRGTTYNQRPGTALNHLCLPSRIRSSKRAQKRKPIRKSNDGLEDDVSKEITGYEPRCRLSRRPRPDFHPKPHGVGEEQGDAPKGGE
jgi:hypothetical protein